MVIPTILFVGLFIGVHGFGSELLANNGVDAEGLTSVEQEQENLNKKWGEESSDQSTWREEEGILERAIGATLVPRIATDIIGVGTTMKTILAEIEEYRWVPYWTSTMLRSVVSTAIFFGLAAAYLRYDI